MNIKEIAEELRKGGIPPAELQNRLDFLCGEYGWVATQWEDAEKNKSMIWLELRKESTSDAQTDRKWELTKNGMNAKLYKMRLKVIEKLISGVKSRMRLMENEMRNQL